MNFFSNVAKLLQKKEHINWSFLFGSLLFLCNIDLSNTAFNVTPKYSTALISPERGGGGEEFKALCAKMDRIRYKAVRCVVKTSKIPTVMFGFICSH